MEPSSPPGSLTSDTESWEKCPEKVLDQSLGEEGNDGSSVTSTSEPSFKDDTASEDFVINQILHSINIVSESREHHYSNNIGGGNPPCGNGWMSGHGAAFPPETHNGLTRGKSAELAGMAGTESVFYCDQGCFVLDQARRGCGHTRHTEKC